MMTAAKRAADASQQPRQKNQHPHQKDPMYMIFVCSRSYAHEGDRRTCRPLACLLFNEKDI